MKVENRKPEQQKEQRVDVRLDGVRKLFGDTVAVDHVDLDVYEGEFFSFLGPSGFDQGVGRHEISVGVIGMQLQQLIELLQGGFALA